MYENLTLKIEDLFYIMGYENSLYEEHIEDNSEAFLVEIPDGYTPIKGFIRKETECSQFHFTNENEENLVLSCANKHLVFENEELKQIQNVKKIDNIYDEDYIFSHKISKGKQTTYDISIDDPHIYLTTNGILHHNTTLIKMIAGLINDYCKIADYPFRYQNIGVNDVSSYQGKSAENVKIKVNQIIDPKVIGLCTIDDIDQVAGKRGDRQSSSGQQEITAVLMETFAGANTVIRGNCTFGMFSNYPENVDDALRQRAGARYLVDGPQTYEDYVDLFYLLLGNNHNIDLGNHDLYATQEIKKVISESFQKYEVPTNKKLLEIFNKLNVKNMKTIAEFGTYLKAIQEMDDRFTGRAIKNITDSIKLRRMDFDLPNEWFSDNPEIFLWQPFETKKNMIKELMIEITPEMIMQEINRYTESELRYSDKSDEVAIENMVRQQKLQKEAMIRYQNSLVKS